MSEIPLVNAEYAPKRMSYIMWQLGEQYWQVLHYFEPRPQLRSGDKIFTEMRNVTMAMNGFEVHVVCDEVETGQWNLSINNVWRGASTAVELEILADHMELLQKYFAKAKELADRTARTE